jgi:hypothetical protein
MFFLLPHKLILIGRNFFQEVEESDSSAAGEASQTKKIGADPFNNQESDPAKCGAMRRFLIILNRCLSLLLWSFTLKSCMAGNHQKVIF